VALLCAAPSALAQSQVAAPPAYALSWVRAEGAEECPTARMLATEVERRLGRQVFDAAAARSFEVQVTRVGGVFHSDVFVRDESGKAIGHRTLQSDEPGCAALFGATALAIALVIDPEAASRDPAVRNSAAFEAPPPPAAPPPAPPPAPTVAPMQREPERPAAPATPSLPTTLVTMSARGQISGGLVPAVSPGLGLSFGARPGARWGFALSGSYAAAQLAEGDAGSVEVGLTRATLALTFDAVSSRSARLVLGAGPSLGALHVGVREPTPVTDAGDFWFVAAELDVALQVAVSKALFVELGGAGLLPLRRQEFLARGQDQPIWGQPALSGTAWAGLGARFP
jgi:hypothetical protein